MVMTHITSTVREILLAACRGITRTYVFTYVPQQSRGDN